MKDNLWFKKKTYGWGWTPCSWQGWTFTLLWIAQLAAVRYFFPDFMNGRGIYFWIYIVAILAVFFAVGYWKGDRPCWTWGRK